MSLQSPADTSDSEDGGSEAPTSVMGDEHIERVMAIINEHSDDDLLDAGAEVIFNFISFQIQEFHIYICMVPLVGIKITKV